MNTGIRDRTYQAGNSTLIEATILAYIRPQESTANNTDTSPVELSGVLTQVVHTIELVRSFQSSFLPYIFVYGF